LKERKLSGEVESNPSFKLDV